MYDGDEVWIQYQPLTWLAMFSLLWKQTLQTLGRSNTFFKL